MSITTSVCLIVQFLVKFWQVRSYSLQAYPNTLIVIVKDRGTSPGFTREKTQNKDLRGKKQDLACTAIKGSFLHA